MDQNFDPLGDPFQRVGQARLTAAEAAAHASIQNN
jgi:hypothetical protein